MNVFGWYLRRSRSRSSAKSSPIVSDTCARTPVMASRTFFSPLAASLASVGRRSGPKMNSAANARTTISPQPIESNTVPPPRGTPSGAAAVGVQGRWRGCPAAERRPSGGVEGGLDLPGAACAHQLDGDRVARVVCIDGDLELLGAADGLAVDGD